ncbi:uncharacterized protein SETTUDRAFT_21263 [Exserohilum turcica Et28A]|uniref:Extracellular serine-rich protein n=1 Tax=Exserohilum turcicum (strain 28A) TaxID=671987 RepID=R0JS38_EXST2|nr:uncharacterized protein SETTUDRAFT_21263 [Exserohilum turcica Et28A]EOA83928.1 hypothetical protein SETTUDRAFT_21263 [Exserohilum turcica Et28A]
MPRSQSWLHTVFLSLVVVIHLPTGLAQDDPASSTESPTTSSIAPDQPSPTNSAPAQTYTIQVGLADHKFKPEVTTANIGDTIEFAFYPRNHSVVRAEYGFPCIPYEMTGASKTGFFAGFHTVDTVLSSPPTYRILINDTDPIFFYCSAPGSCLTYGMVGAINPNASMSVQKQQQLALSSTYMLNPGEPFPDESPSASNPATSSATANTDTGKPADEKGLSTGAIVGIVVGGSSIIFVAALFFFFWGRTTSLANEEEKEEIEEEKEKEKEKEKGLITMNG